jgi:hypothetical protein
MFMKKRRLRSILILMLIFTGISSGFTQKASSVLPDENMEKRYTDYITSALRFQVRADSLTRSANQDRRRLAFTGNDAERETLSNRIMLTERESFRVQRRADSLYSLAREIEDRLMATGRRQSDGTLAFSDRVSGPAPSFLVLNGRNISSGLSSADLLKAMELDGEFSRANLLMDELDGINDNLMHLVMVLESRPRRRERRRISREIGRLEDRSFEIRMEAMKVYEKVNALKYNAALRFLGEQRRHITDSLVVRSGIMHEQLAREAFSQAAGLRKTALDLRSDKYIEDHILKAYNEELQAFSELGKALEIYQTPPPSRAGQMRELPLQAGGQVDAGSALARSRAAAAAASGPPAVINNGNQNAPVIEFGFSVLPRSPYSASNPVPSGFRLPDGLVYSIQLGIFRTIQTPESFGGLYPVMSMRESDNQSVRYLTGVFRTVAEAEKALLEVNRRNFTDAFVVAFNNGSMMPVSRARQMERERAERARLAGQVAASPSISGQPSVPAAGGNSATTGQGAVGVPVQAAAGSSASGQPSVPVTTGSSGQAAAGSQGGADAPVTATAPAGSAALANAQATAGPGGQAVSGSPDGVSAAAERVVFKIQLGAFREIVQPSVHRNWQNLAGGKNVEHSRNNNGLYVYSIGNFNTFEEASLMLNELRRQGLPDAFIVPYRGNMRITIEEARKLMLL